MGRLRRAGQAIRQGNLPLQRILQRLYRGEHDLVCIKIDHLAADVGGMKQYVYLLGDVYGRLGDDPAYRPGPNLLARRDQRQIYAPLGPRGWLRALRPR